MVTMFCAPYQKRIKLQNLHYWNVELQAYFSPLEANESFKRKKK